MRLYLSGPMSGKPDYNYPLFRDVARYFRDGPPRHSTYGMEVEEVFSPAEIDGGSQVWEGAKVEPWEYYMRKALELQLKCNAIALLPGWTESKGAKREFDIAVDLKFKLFLVFTDTRLDGDFYDLRRFS